MTLWLEASNPKSSFFEVCFYGREYITFLFYQVTLRDHIINRIFDLVKSNPLTLVTTVSNLCL